MDFLKLIDKRAAGMRDNTVTDHESGFEPRGQSVNAFRSEGRHIVLLQGRLQEDSSIRLPVDYASGHYAASRRRRWINAPRAQLERFGELGSSSAAASS